MEMKQGIEEVKRIFGEYTGALDKLDSKRIEILLKDYQEKLADLLYERGIDGVDIEEIMQQIKEEVAYDTWRYDEEGNFAKKYDRSEAREDSQFKKEINRKVEDIEEEGNEEKEAYVKSLPYTIETVSEEEKYNSTHAFSNYLEDFLSASNQIVLMQMNRVGYYNFDDFDFDLRSVTRQVGERNLSDYEVDIEDLNRVLLQQVSENLDSVKFAEVEKRVEENITLENKLDVEAIRVANQTLMEEMQIDVNMAQEIYRRIC